MPMQGTSGRLVGTTPALIAWGLGGSGAIPVAAQIEFDERLLLGAVNDVSGVAVSDLDSDGRRDVTLCEEIESALLFMNRGNLIFSRSGLLYEPESRFSSMHHVDLNGDEHIDVLWAKQSDTQSQIQIIYNLGPGRGGRFETVPSSGLVLASAISDVTGDGRPDLVVLHQRSVVVFRNAGGQLVQDSSWGLPDAYARDLALGDIDDDGDVDIAVVSDESDHDSMYGWKVYDTHLNILFNNGQGQFTDRFVERLPYGGGEYDIPVPVDVDLADLDGDGDLDVAMIAANMTSWDPVNVLLLRNVTQGRSFNQIPKYFFGSSSGHATIAAGDLDADGDIDLVMTDVGGEPWILSNRGDFDFELQQLNSLAGNYSPTPLVTDIDNDGRFDLVLGGSGGVSILMNQTSHDGPILEHNSLRRGRTVGFRVPNALPNEKVYFLSSFDEAGNGRGLAEFGGLTTDLGGEIKVIGSAIADENGVAEVAVDIPSNAPLSQVILQAVIRRGPRGVDSVKTPFQTARIRD